MSKFSKLPNYLLILTLLTLTRIPNFSFSHPLHQNPNFDPDTTLSASAQLINGSVHLNRTIISSTHRFIIIKNESLRFIQSNPISFSTHFSCSISPHNVLSFVLKPVSKSSRKSVGVMFSGDSVGVEVSGRVGKALGVSGGEKFRSWVDYEASSKRIEIRVGEFGGKRPYNPVLVYPIDLGEMWEDEEVFVGLGSVGGGDVGVYSWSFAVRGVPKWLHSKPMNPLDLGNGNGEGKVEKKKRFCRFGVFTFGCGALAAMVLLSLWAIFVDRSAVVADEESVLPVDFKYQKIDVVVKNGLKDGKK